MNSNLSIICPVCSNSKSQTFIMKLFKNLHNPKKYEFLKNEGLYECSNCGTIYRPTLNKDMKMEDLGIQYYDQVNVNDMFKKNIINHIENHQKPQYDRIRDYILNKFDIEKYNNWLDVGSAGYPTSFKDINFLTIEPDPRVVKVGQELFNKNNISCNIVENFKPDSKIDGVLFANSFYCIPTPNEAIQNVFNILNDNGKVIVMIGHYFMGSKISPAQDGEYVAIEDLIRGITLWVYYNPYSLEYIFNKNGFRLIDKFTFNHNHKIEKRSINVLVFEKHKRDINNELLEKSKNSNMNLLNNFFSNNKKNTIKTIKEELENKNTLIIGSTCLINDILKISESTENLTIYNFNNEKLLNNKNSTIIKTLSQLKNEINSKTFNKIAICSFKYQNEILNFINENNLKVKKIILPTRESGDDKIWGNFKQNNEFVRNLKFKLYLPENIKLGDNFTNFINDMKKNNLQIKNIGFIPANDLTEYAVKKLILESNNKFNLFVFDKNKKKPFPFDLFDYSSEKLKICENIIIMSPNYAKDIKSDLMKNGVNKSNIEIII